MYKFKHIVDTLRISMYYLDSKIIIICKIIIIFCITFMNYYIIYTNYDNMLYRLFSNK